jgi:Fur family ferric uptake transcriptional regulator
MQNKFQAALRAHKSRVTRQKSAVFDYLLHAGKPVYINQICRALPTINRSSVYRILDGFTKIGVAKRVPRGFKTLYEIGEIFHQHHHHITCQRCGKTLPIHSPILEKLIAQISRRAGMKPTGHQIELYGICADCLSSAAALKEIIS